MLQFHLENHISEPTRITDQSQTCLDLFLSNLQDKVNIARVSHPVGNSDHCTVELQIKLNFHINKTYKRLVWDYQNANFENFCKQLKDAPLGDCLDVNDVNGSSDRWTELFLSIARENIPNKIVTIRPNDKPFYKNEHRKLRRKRDRAHREAKRLKTNSLWEKYQQSVICIIVVLLRPKRSMT